MSIKSKSLFLCYFDELIKTDCIIRFFDELQDEIVCFIDKKGNIKVFSSVCPHFGGEIHYKKSENVLVCKWHNWKFCSGNGKCVSYPVKIGLNPYDFTINPDNLKKYKVKKLKRKIFIKYEA